MYCNWLSKQEGISPSQWIYPTGRDVAEGQTLPHDYLQRTGYRLPTETEWEFAVRAGSTTARFFGSAENLLREYAWYSRNPPRSRNDQPDPSDPQRTWPVGQRKPNDLGLFDVYGNVWEWMQDRMRDLRASGDPRNDVEDSVLLVSDAFARVRRGGSFAYEAAMQRSAHRGPTTALPSQRRDNVGFRVARTHRATTASASR
jgi:eukaryotic-like serine/threonine-protein kinase